MIELKFDLSDFTDVAQREAWIENMLQQPCGRLLIDARHLQIIGAKDESRQVEFFFKYMIERMRRDHYPIPQLAVILPADDRFGFEAALRELGRIAQLQFEFVRDE